MLFFAILFNRKSGRLRTQKLIPVSNLEIALVRLLAFIGFWICLAFILVVFYIINFGYLPNNNWLINLMSISGIMFLINSVPILYSDFYSTYFRKTEKVLFFLREGANFTSILLNITVIRVKESFFILLVL